ncbi:MAG: UDP-N-acetylmuramoyl-L-alanine--D-glutamate ligase [Chlorobiaceae bacterium]|nr:UDP-N-acetylmuramoyl-L-alanine--D-glutamate ligase [Chlorobiaceae bacterium]NTW73352.1 UDP-N-acetylmuramoyl-L-alanine--D-glutamate ligase [Chlorobiaceae bacterium]
MKPEELRGKKVSVIGAGKSGQAAAALLMKAGASPFISEFGAISPEGRTMASGAGVPFEEGGHSERVYEADFSVVSPGVPQSAPVLIELERRGVPVYSEIEVASWFCPARVIAITGTDGKTTTATLLHRVCETEARAKGFRAFSVGNIGVPFSLKALEAREDDLVVLELSSYQLERCVTFRPDVAVLTNITPDHMDRYGGDISAYAAAKFRIHANQVGRDTLIYNHDDPLLRGHFASGEPWPFRVVRFGLHDVAPEEGVACVTVRDGSIVILGGASDIVIIDVAEFVKPSFRGEHNLYNALAAVAAATAAGVSVTAIREGLVNFGGVEHRQEFAGSALGLEWINDSKATNINAMRQALQAVPAGMVLIAGGRDKGNDYGSVTGLVREKVAGIVAIGESKLKIAAAFEGVVPVETADTLQSAVSTAARMAARGATVLFSPGCSSFDMFRDFEDRGEQFKQLVRELAS